MKKLVLLFIITVTLFGCSSSSNTDALEKENAELKKKLEKYENTTTSEVTTESLKSNATKQNSTFKTEQYELTKYIFKINSNKIYSPNTEAVVILKNLTNDTVNVNLKLSLKDLDNNIIGIKDLSASCIAPNQETVMWTFDAKDFVDFEYNVSMTGINFSKEYNKSITDVLKIEDKLLDDRILITAINTGTKKICSFGCIVLYFKDNNVAYLDVLNIANSEYGLNPSESSSAESLIYVDYDYYKIFPLGYFDFS